jgi:hypothetical protein
MSFVHHFGYAGHQGYDFPTLFERKKIIIKVDDEIEDLDNIEWNLRIDKKRTIKHKNAFCEAVIENVNEKKKIGRT